MTPAQRSQLLGHLARARLVLFVLLADPTVSALVHEWAVRVPLIGVVVWFLEVIVRSVRPVQAAQPNVVRTQSQAPVPVVAPPYTPPPGGEAP